jgi:hypothetical protein
MDGEHGSQDGKKKTQTKETADEAQGQKGIDEICSSSYTHWMRDCIYNRYRTLITELDTKILLYAL